MNIITIAVEFIFKSRIMKEFIGELLGTFILILFGWGSAALPDDHGGFFFVYILGPVIGGSVAALFFQYILEPVMKKKSK